MLPFSSRSPISTEPISLVLLADSNTTTIEEIVGAWMGELERLNRPFEVLLVHDGGGDEAGAWADTLTAKYSQLRVMRHSSRLGVGAALRAGIAETRHPLLAYTTCDRQYQPGDLKKLLEVIDHVDLVTGYRTGRAVPGWLRGLGFVYRLTVRILLGVPLEPMPAWLGWRGVRRRWLARWIFGIRLFDVECAFRLFRREIFARLPIQSKGPFVHVEILAKANFLGCFMDQVPVRYQPVEGTAGADDFSKEALRLFRAPEFGRA